MKYSRALLDTAEIGSKLYSNSVSKTKELLTDIFGLSFDPDDDRILSFSNNPDTMVFEVKFRLNERTIYATHSYEKCGDDLVQEVVVITESVTEDLPLPDLPTDYKKAIDHVMDLLEEKYDLDFTPLDPLEEDENISIINNDPSDGRMEVVFKHEDHEAVFTAVFRFMENGSSDLTVKQNKRHVIYLD
jgi:hypothetical protein